MNQGHAAGKCGGAEACIQCPVVLYIAYGLVLDTRDGGQATRECCGKTNINR